MTSREGTHEIRSDVRGSAGNIETKLGGTAAETCMVIVLEAMKMQRPDSAAGESGALRAVAEAGVDFASRQALVVLDEG